MAKKQEKSVGAGKSMAREKTSPAGKAKQQTRGMAKCSVKGKAIHI